MPLKSETATSNRVHPVAWTQCTDAHRARAVTQLPGESSHRTRSIAAITAGSSGRVLQPVGLGFLQCPRLCRRARRRQGSVGPRGWLLGEVDHRGAGCVRLHRLNALLGTRLRLISLTGSDDFAIGRLEGKRNLPAWSLLISNLAAMVTRFPVVALTGPVIPPARHHIRNGNVSLSRMW
jgi:hypothetical protein